MWCWTSFISVLLFIPTVFFSGCAKSPERVVCKYLNYTFLDNDGEDAYTLLASDNKALISQEAFIGEVKKKNVLNSHILKKYEKFFAYKVLKTENRGDTIAVFVEITKPKAVNVLEALVNYAMHTSFAGLPVGERVKAINQKFNAIMMSRDRALVSEEKIFKVIREKEGYKVYLSPNNTEQEEMLAIKKGLGFSEGSSVKLTFN